MEEQLPVWRRLIANNPVDGTGNSLRRVDSVGSGEELFGTGAAGECDTGADDTDHESADVGSGDTGDLVFAEGEKWQRRDVFEGFAAGGSGQGVGGAATSCITGNEECGLREFDFQMMRTFRV